MLKVNLNGQFFTYVTSPDDLPNLAFDHGLNVADLSIDTTDLAAYQADQKRQKIRSEIGKMADTQSIQGTIADNVGYLLESVYGLAAVLSTANINQSVTNAANKIKTELKPLADGIADGSITLTHHVKTTETVVKEAGERANAVSQVLKDNT